jgi:activating signal cointegrator complex subunit 1
MINTIYRRPRHKGPRLPVSYSAILASPAFSSIAVAAAAATNEAAPPEPATDDAGAGAPDTGDAEAPAGRPRPKAKRAKQAPVGVDLGVWTVDEVQICEMGSHGPEGEYVCAGKIALAG